MIFGEKPGDPFALHQEAEADGDHDLARAHQLAVLEAGRVRAERHHRLVVRYTLREADYLALLAAERDLRLLHFRLECRAADPSAASDLEELADEMAGRRRERARRAAGPSPLAGLSTADRRALRDRFTARRSFVELHRAYAEAAGAAADEGPALAPETFRTLFGDRVGRRLGLEPGGDPVAAVRAAFEAAYLLFDVDGEPRLDRRREPLSPDRIFGV